MKELIIKVALCKHPIYDGAFDVLFSDGETELKSLDGNTVEELEEVGLTEVQITTFPANSRIPYEVMAKSLSMKLKDLELHVKFKDLKKTMRQFHEIAVKLTRKEIELGEEFDIPENVVSLANLPNALFM